MIDLGQVYEATLTLPGQSSPPSTAVLTITLPDGTTVTPSVGPGAASGSDWLISYDYATTMAGLHKASWVTTGPGTAVVDYFSVRQFISVISLAEAKDHLNITRVLPDGGAELRRFMQAATEVVESKAGICVRRQFTDRVSDGCRELVLPRRPVLSVTSVASVWPGGPSWTAGQLVLDGEAGIVSQAAPMGLPFWYGPWDVTYACGRAVVDERFIHAAKEQLRHLWETQRGAQPPSLAPGEESFATSAGWAFSVPRRVLELLEDDMVPSS